MHGSMHKWKGCAEHFTVERQAGAEKNYVLRNKNTFNCHFYKFQQRNISDKLKIKFFCNLQFTFWWLQNIDRVKVIPVKTQAWFSCNGCVNALFSTYFRCITFCFDLKMKTIHHAWFRKGFRFRNLWQLEETPNEPRRNEALQVHNMW